MEKTAKEWFEEISHEPTRLRAIANIDTISTYDSISNALRCSFTWRNTQEGDFYWNRVFKHFNKGKNNPKKLSKIETKYLKNAD